MQIKHIPGTNYGKVILYTLSTCPWCKKTKQFLIDKGVEYDYIDVDLLIGQEKENTIKMIEKWNPNCSFPTIVVNENEYIVGYDEDEISRVLKL